MSLLAKKGKAIVAGLKVLGNTVAGISPSNLRLLYKTVVIPAITYGSQLWFNPERPNKVLIRQLEQVQHQALKQVAGAFWDSPEEALQMLTYVPPITTTLHKLYRSAALRIPRLPLTSEITRRIPADYLPSTAHMTQWIIPPKHIPFARPRANETLSPLTRMVTTFNSHTERAEPFHTQNAPHHQRLSSDPFNGWLTIKPEACSKKERKSLVANQRIWLEIQTGRNTLVLVTDGSLTNKAAGWAVTGIHAGHTLFKHKVPLAKRAGNHDTEMMALAHASKLVYETMLGELDIREFRIFSDSTAALTSIFDPGPHATQHASLMFRKNMIRLFTSRPDITGTLLWTPGHGGLDQMKVTDKNACAAANMKCCDSGYLLPHFVSRSSALTEVETMALKEWRDFLEDLEDHDKKIFRPASGFLPFARARRLPTSSSSDPQVVQAHQPKFHVYSYTDVH